MQFSLAIIATLLSVAAAVPAPTITPAPKVPSGDDWTTGPKNCPASKTITNWQRMCPMFICETPRDAPCSPMKTVTSWVDWQCTARPPTTTTVLAPCNNGCSCPKATVTSIAF